MTVAAETNEMHADELINDAKTRGPWRGLVGVLLVGLLLRVVVIAFQFEQLAVDTDAYLEIAERLRAGDGFCSVPGQPTAYRPPLFPWLVAVSTHLGGMFGLAVLQTLLGLISIAATWWLAQRVGLSRWGAVLAAGVVAVDPMLLLYSSRAMTEVLMTTLTIGFFATLWLPRTGWKSSIIAGVMFGLLALCRPSIWPFAMLAAMGGAFELLKNRRFEWSACGGFLLAAMLTLLPWCARNAVVLGRPIITTTHGGYTALLGNNDAFDTAVASQPFGATWSTESFNDWQRGVEAELERQGISRTDELRRDAAMMQMAQAWIQKHPDRFVRAAWYRLRNLWSPAPLADSELPRVVIFVVRVGYVGLAFLAVIGGFCATVDRRLRTLVLVFVLSLTGLHCVFWANARMRAPTHPLLAILAAGAISQIADRRRRPANRP